MKGKIDNGEFLREYFLPVTNRYQKYKLSELSNNN